MNPKTNKITHVWDQTIAIDQSLAKQLIEKQTPLLVSSIKPLGEGWDNIAYLINEKYVFRFPRREIGIDCMNKEIAILPYIAAHVSFQFSYPQYIGNKSYIYQAPFSGSLLMKGESLSETDAQLIDDVVFAKTLASWLKELHSVPILEKDRDSDPMKRYDFKNKLQRCMERIVQYEAYFTHAGFSSNELIMAVEKLSKYENYTVEKTSYVHGDLYSQHLFVNANRQPSGIIDWGDIHIGNPGIDLAIGYMILSDITLKHFVETYGDITNAMRYLAILTNFHHPIAAIPYCSEKNEEPLKQWEILSLRRALEAIKTL